MTIMLDNRVAVYIPSTYDINKPIDSTRQVNRALEYLTTLFGGSTAIQSARGVWQSETLGLIHEKITIIESFCSADSLTRNIRDIRKFAREIKHELQQESIAIKVNNTLELL